MYAFTSSSYLLGVKGDHELAARLAERTRGIPVVISSLSAVAGLQALGVRRIALIHPPWYAPELDRLGAQYFRSQGFDVVFHAPAPLRPDFGEIFPSQIHEWARAHVPDRAEAVFIGGTGMRAVGAIRPLEEDLGRPVLTANQVSLWRALQIADAHAAVAGYGRLFTV